MKLSTFQYHANPKKEEFLRPQLSFDSLGTLKMKPAQFGDSFYKRDWIGEWWGRAWQLGPR